MISLPDFSGMPICDFLKLLLSILSQKVYLGEEAKLQG